MSYAWDNIPRDPIADDEELEDRYTAYYRRQIDAPVVESKLWKGVLSASVALCILFLIVFWLRVWL